MNADDMVRIGKAVRDFIEVVHEFEHKQWHEPKMEMLEKIDGKLHGLMDEVLGVEKLCLSCAHVIERRKLGTTEDPSETWYKCSVLDITFLEEEAAECAEYEVRDASS